MGNGGFRAGVGRIIVNPPLTAPQGNWGAQTHVVPDGIEADIWATVLVVADDLELAAFVDLDLVILTREENDAIRAAVGAVLGVPPRAVRVSVTHSHAGSPPSAWAWAVEGREALAAYYALLPEQVAGAARLALRGLRPARVDVDRGESRVAVNRREIAPDGRRATGANPGGAIDPQVFVVRIDDRQGGPLAAIVGYTMHPTTLGPTNRLVSPDWPGHLKRMVEKISGATCLFAQGATGDVGPGPAGLTDDVGVVRRIGAQVGCEAARVYLGIELPPVRYRHERIWESGTALGKWTSEPAEAPKPAVRTATATIDLPVIAQPPLGEAETAALAAERTLNDLWAAGAPAAEIEAATFATKRANMVLNRSRLFGGGATSPVELHLLQIGPAVFAGTEGEPFCGIGLAIKERSPIAHTWFGGYTGGWGAYIPTADEYLSGGYEVETSPFTPEAAQRLVDETVAALHALAASP